LAYEKYIAAVAVSNTSYGYDRRYKYLIPTDMEGRVFVGVRVIVPFGNGNRKRIGVVIRIDNVSELPEGEDAVTFKPLRSVIDNEPLLNAEMLELMMWIRETTLCTYFEAFRTLIPIGLGVNFTMKYTVPENRPTDIGILSDKARKLWEDLNEDMDCLGGASAGVISELVEKGFLAEKEDVKRRRRDETIKMLRLTEGYINGTSRPDTSPKQTAVVKLLEDCGAAAVKEVLYICGVSVGVIDALKKKEIVETFDYETIITPDVTADASVDDIILTDEQTECFNGISALIDAGKPDAALLYGVTGSGKTSVFVKLIQYVLQKGRNVIMLIPEISLTPQVVSRFTSLFGELVSVMHSSLSLSQRLNEYKRVKSGGARIVVGTRSAVFAPLDNIGLIIMDEEGERTYKSESSPKYNARDIAKKRCVTHNAVLLMASATPSVESYYYAVSGRYKLFTMEKRYSGGALPEVEIVDLATSPFYSGSSTFSERLIDEININLRRGEQTILLLNRRGYYTIISCCDCKYTVSCPNCSVPLTYHKANNRLMCHYCGHMEDMVSVCPKCGKNHLKMTGLGTQRVEDEIAKLFPDARILRMDADTASSRYAYEKNFKAFENGEYDIMLGTQMIAKGLDFPNVTLVGVLSVDKALFSGDFRSYERTFSLITQVVGRCGRGEKQGRAFIQTYVPNHYVINLAAEQNYKEFFRQECEMRKALIYPPFCDTCMLEFSSEIDKCAEEAASCFMRLLREKIESEEPHFPLRALEPSRCTYEKLNGKFRYRLIIKCRNNSEFRKFIGGIYKNIFKMKEFANVQTSLDINGDISI
jgi:primosomal protein N' (replication factor Y)